jgi:hypothetical protein
MNQLHKRFTDEQVSVLHQENCNGCDPSLPVRHGGPWHHGQDHPVRALRVHTETLWAQRLHRGPLLLCRLYRQVGSVVWDWDTLVWWCSLQYCPRPHLHRARTFVWKRGPQMCGKSGILGGKGKTRLRSFALFSCSTSLRISTVALACSLCTSGTSKSACPNGIRNLIHIALREPDTGGQIDPLLGQPLCHG